jgi:hypothetical protein
MLMALLDIFRRRTVHRLADELQQQLIDAEPDAVMLAAFYREGRRDGRRGRSPSPCQGYVVEAVELASSLIVQEYVEALEELSKEESSLSMRAAGGRQQLSEMDQKPSGEPQPRPDATGLAGSLQQWEARRAERSAEARRQQRAQIGETEAALSVVEDRRQDLANRFAQMVVSAEEAGQLLWARYRAGFEAGATASKVQQGERPESTVAFETPAMLTRGATGLAEPTTGTER